MGEALASVLTVHSLPHVLTEEVNTKAVVLGCRGTDPWSLPWLTGVPGVPGVRGGCRNSRTLSGFLLHQTRTRSFLPYVEVDSFLL
jgi:hypothetical protein